MRDASGGVCEDLEVRVLEFVCGVGSIMNTSLVSSAALWSSEQGAMETEMEGLRLLVGGRGVEGLPALEVVLMGDWTSLSCWGSDLQESVLRSPPAATE